MTVPYLPYAKQSISENDIHAVQEALKGEWITRGPQVAEFEQAVADDCGAKYAVAFNNGTTALMAAYFAGEISPHDWVISTTNSYIATVGIPIQMGLKIHFVDIDRKTGNLDLALAEKALSFQASRGKPFLVPVHFSGIPVDMQRLESYVKHPDAIIIEDAAHAIGSIYPSGEKVGSCAYSQMTVFSFHPAKTITTGEGGMVTTNDEKLYHRLQLYRNNGIEKSAPYLQKPAALGYYEVHAITGNFNFTSFQAALGLSQFKTLEEKIAKRRSLVKHYRQQLKSMDKVKLFTDAFDEVTGFHLFIVQIDFEAFKTTRERVMRALKERGIGTEVHYIPLYRHPVMHLPEETKELFPETEKYYAQALSLPLYSDLTQSEVDRVCKELRAMLNNE